MVWGVKTTRTLVLIFVGLCALQTITTAMLSVNYKVFGKVQGVFFRKFTKAKAEQLGLVGWVQNERDGTVIGCVQGDDPKIQTMKTWLSTEGSPHGRVDKCQFSDERNIDKLEFDSFVIRH